MVSSHYIIVLSHSAFYEPSGSGTDTCLCYGQAAAGARASGPDAEAARPDFRGQPDHDCHGRKKGERSPSLIICLRVADALGLNLDDVLKEVRKKRRRK
jgi:hypothetical protein